MRLDAWTLALQAINFLVLVLLLRHFLYRPIARGLARRKTETEKAFADTAAGLARAEESRKRYDADRASLANERERMLAEARNQIEAERKQLLEDTRAHTDKLTETARQKLREERNATTQQLRALATQLAVDLAERLLRQAAVPAVTDALLERLDERLTRLPAPELDALRSQVTNGHVLHIVTASALSREALAKWRERLAGRLGPRAHIDFETDDRLIAGAELRFPTTVLRLSWRDALDDAKRELPGDALAH